MFSNRKKYTGLVCFSRVTAFKMHQGQCLSFYSVGSSHLSSELFVLLSFFPKDHSVLIKCTKWREFCAYYIQAVHHWSNPQKRLIFTNPMSANYFQKCFVLQSTLSLLLFSFFLLSALTVLMYSTGWSFVSTRCLQKLRCIKSSTNITSTQCRWRKWSFTDYLQGQNNLHLVS